MGFSAGEQPAKRFRYEGEWNNTTGEYDTTSTQETDVWIAQRQARPDEVEHLAGGEIDSEFIAIETRWTLRTVDDGDNGHPADYIEVGIRDNSETKRYKIVEAEPPRNRREDKYFAIGKQV